MAGKFEIPVGALTLPDPAAGTPGILNISELNDKRRAELLAELGVKEADLANLKSGESITVSDDLIKVVKRGQSIWLWVAAAAVAGIGVGIASTLAVQKFMGDESEVLDGGNLHQMGAVG